MFINNAKNNVKSALSDLNSRKITLKLFLLTRFIDLVGVKENAMKRESLANSVYNCVEKESLALKLRREDRPCNQDRI